MWGAPVIELDGLALADAIGLHITASDSTVRGLVIYGFGAPAGSTNGVGIQLENSTGHLIEGNFIGTDVTGLLARPNRLNGILMSNADVSTVGGTTPASRNIISGNGSDGLLVTGGSSQNVVSGNYIGLNRPERRRLATAAMASSFRRLARPRTLLAAGLPRQGTSSPETAVTASRSTRGAAPTRSSATTSAPT